MAKNAAVTAKAKPKDGKKSAGTRFIRFFKDLKSEVKKVVWPSKKQIKNNTIVVLLFMVVAAVFLWILDGVLGLLVSLIFG